MTRSLTRRSVLALMSVGATGAIVAACGGPPPAATPTAAPKPAEAPKPGAPTAAPAAQAPAPAPTATPLPPVAIKPGLPVLQYFTGLTGPDGQVMRDIVVKHNDENSKFQVNIEIMPWVDMFAKVIAVLAAGQPLDVAIMHPADMPQFTDSGAITPVMDQLDPLGLKTTDWLPQPVKWNEFNGKLYGMPLDQHQWNMWLRTDIAEQAGLDPKNPPKDGKTLVEWATKMTKKTGDTIERAGWAIGYPNPKAPMWSAIYSNGGQWYSEDGKKCTVNTPEAAEATQWLVDLFGKVATSSNDLLSDFVTGSAAMFMSGPWNIPGLLKQQGIKFDVFQTPNFFKKQVVPASGHSLTLPRNKDSGRMRMAGEFLKWVSDHSDMWIASGQIPVRKTILESKAFTDAPYRKVFLDSIPNTIMWTNIKTYNEFTSPTGAERANIELIFTKKIGVKEGLAKMEKESNEALARTS